MQFMESNTGLNEIILNLIVTIVNDLLFISIMFLQLLANCNLFLCRNIFILKCSEMCCSLYISLKAILDFVS